jgi:hypothetical protein
MSPGVTLTAERLTTLCAYPAFLLFLGLVRHPQSRCIVARGRRGAFKLQLLDSHRKTPVIMALPTRHPVCVTTFRRRFPGWQESGPHRGLQGCRDKAGVNCGCIGLLVRRTVRSTLSSVHPWVEHLFQIDIVSAKKLIVIVLFGPKVSEPLPSLCSLYNSRWLRTHPPHAYSRAATHLPMG